MGFPDHVRQPYFLRFLVHQFCPHNYPIYLAFGGLEHCNMPLCVHVLGFDIKPDFIYQLGRLRRKCGQLETSLVTFVVMSRLENWASTKKNSQRIN